MYMSGGGHRGSFPLFSAISMLASIDPRRGNSVMEVGGGGGGGGGYTQISSGNVFMHVCMNDTGLEISCMLGGAASHHLVLC